MNHCTRILPTPILTGLVVSAFAAAFGLGAQAAPLANPLAQPLNYIATPGISSYNVGTGLAVVFSPWFENGTWQGDLRANPVNAAGVVNATSNWSAGAVFANTSGANSNSVSSTYWSATSGFKRVIITTDGAYGSGWTGNVPGDANKLPFRYNNYTTTPSPIAGTVLNSTQQTSITTVAADQQKIINFVRGQRSNERISAGQGTASLPANATGTLRERYSILGDIVHSNPVYVGAPVKPYNFDSYSTFKIANTSRAGRVYVGSNDGMLHAFDLGNGQEMFAYIPSMVVPNLAKLSALSYTHTYFVDGEITSGDVYVSSAACASSPCWRSMLVGGLGAGGKGFYALDVTTAVADTDTEADVRAKVVWEVGAPSKTVDSDLGYTFSRPSIVRLKTGQWVMIAGNGYDSPNGKPVLYIVDMATGAVAKSYASTTSGTATDKNGLSSPTVTDIDFDGFADYAYAGDIDGNMWRFDLTQVTSGLLTGDVSTQVTSYKLYSGSSTQPILYAPDVRLSLDGGYMVYFGTGRGFTAADIASVEVQAVYGLHDIGAAINPSSIALVAQTLAAATYPSPSTNIRTSSTNTVGYSTKNGWKVDFPAGERVFGNIQVRAGRVQFVSSNTTTTPYQNWLMQLDDDAGGTPRITVFDLNADSKLTDTDRVDANGNGSLADRVDIPVGKRINEGTTPIRVASQPMIVFLSNGLDALLVTSENLPTNIITPCEVNCGGGFTGGHMDVDTDSPSGGVRTGAGTGMGGSTDGHTHEYDKIHGQVYVDYFTLEPRRGLTRADDPSRSVSTGNLNRLTEVWAKGTTSATFDKDKKFLILIANADLSTGGKITIGSASPVSVKDYQDAIINKIQTGTVATSDLYTLNQLLGTTLAGNNPSANGTTIPGALRIAFNEASIIQGGLVPTATGCVRDGTGAKFYNGRWRNAALTLHLIAVDATSDLAGTQTSLKAKVKIQPDDLTTAAVEKTGVTADYVISGGTVAATATSSPVYLYESTLFWHWNSSQDIGGQLCSLSASCCTNGQSRVSSTPCYGETDYQTSVVKFRSNQILTQTELNCLNNQINKLQNSASSKDKANATKMRDLLNQLPTGSSSGGGGVVVVTPSASSTNTTQKQTVTTGPLQFQGQRGWGERRMSR